MRTPSDLESAHAPSDKLSDRERLLRLMLAADRERRQTTRTIAPRGNAEGPVPLSYEQERLWFLDQLGLVGTAYNVPMALRLEGNLNVEALERSFAELVRRHDTLRTRFGTQDGVPHQLIDPPGLFELHQIDLSDVAYPAREQQLRECMHREQLHRFDLCASPPFRVVLVRLGVRDHALLLTMHHIASDAWSLGVLMQEVSTLYAAYMRGQPSPLPELVVQYADYAMWQRQWLQGEVLQEQLQYWKERLQGVSPQLQLPTDRPRPSVESYNGATLSVELSATLSEALKELGRREGATLFMVALAAYQLLLSRWSGQRDIVVGSPIAGRRQREIEGLIGFFVNTLALRTEVSEDLSFRQLLSRVKEMTLGAYAHQELPFEMLVKELRPDRDLARQPIFQVMVSLESLPEEQPQLPGLAWTWTSAESVTTHFDLTLHLLETPTGLSGVFEYATDLFDAGTIERMAEHLRILLEGIVADSDCPIHQLPLLSEAEKQQLLVEWNTTSTPYPQEKLIHEQFEEQVKRTPEAVAVVCEGQFLTYADLNRKANRLARYLRDKGVGPDQLVVVCVERGIEMVIGWLGILKAGGAYVPLDPSHPIERLQYMLENAAPRVLLTQESLKSTFLPIAAEVMALDSDWAEIGEWGDEDFDPRSLQLTSRHLAYVIYTSGSTGNPKGVMVTHRNVANLVQWDCTAFELAEGMRCSCVAAVGFDAAVLEVWPPLSVGATLVIASPKVSANPEELLLWWASQALDVSFLPTPIAELAFSQGISNEKLRTLLVGGDRLRHRPASASFRLVNNYGPTESTVAATSGEIHDAVLHIGRPISNTQIYILDSHLHLAPIGVAGEIYIGGAGVARGYLNQPELTQQRFVADPFSADPQARMYQTGDLGRWRADGTIEYLGRNDHQVKIRGFRIELGEIEAQLAKHPKLKETVVLAREDVPGEKRLVAYVTTRDDSVADAEELREQLQAHLKKILPEYMVPSAFVSLESLPLTSSGKLDRRALPAPGLEAYVSRQYEPAQGEIEKVLAEIWQGLLGMERVGRQDNFFELGGHSLLGMKLIAKIAERLMVQLSAIAVFQYPTIRQMAEFVESLRSEGGARLGAEEIESEEGIL